MEIITNICNINSHTISGRTTHIAKTETETLGCLWPWSISRSFISNICLSLSDVSWHQLNCQFTKKNVIVPLPLSITQSNHSLPTPSRVVQVAQLWEETEAVLASINVLITTLTWCSPDNKEACAHQSAGKWRYGQSVQVAWVVSIPSSQWHQYLKWILGPPRVLQMCNYRGEAALWGLSWISLVGT